MRWWGFLKGIPAALVAECGECNRRLQRTDLREFDQRQVCSECFETVLIGAREAMAAMALKAQEPERVCSNCRAMIDPKVSSAWCSVLEIGDERATICKSFIPLTPWEAAPIFADGAVVTDATELWNLVCSDLEESLGSSHRDWLRNTRSNALKGRTLHVDVEDDFTRSWLVARLMPGNLPVAGT